ncbi:ubiquitin-specific protease otu1 [Microbotryomycetes sp. JL201]|nr:ubiquitin-specific protease otu1 [Microbotryomycetes sp. JL201]
MSPITVRIRGPAGVSSAQINDDDTLASLQLTVKDKTGIDPDRQELRTGFPPKFIPTDTPSSEKLSSLGIKSGEQIVAAEGAVRRTLHATALVSAAPTPPMPAVGTSSVVSQSEQSSSEFSRATTELKSIPVDGGHLILRSKNAWGGAIELSILADRYQVEICSIDVQTGRMDRFGDGKGYSSQCFLVYSGIHYDALTFSFVGPDIAAESLEFDVLKFESGSEQARAVTQAALELVSRLRKEHAYTDAATFTLKCEQCGAAIVGEKDARAHAMQTGHTSFGEYDG